MSTKPHPDRLTTTLAQRQNLLAQAGREPWVLPGPGSADARVDLKLLLWECQAALAQRGTEAAQRRLEGLDTPDLLAGTIQDGTARGLMAALEEAISLCGPSSQDEEQEQEQEQEPVVEEITDPKALRRKREFLVASKTARIRFSRRTGIILVDRLQHIHEENCIQFEDRGDAGCLDGFVPREGERARLFSPAFLKPVLYSEAEAEEAGAQQRLVLAGRLGPRRHGFPCRLSIQAREDRPGIQLAVEVENRYQDHRLRIRFLGLKQRQYIEHRGTPAWEQVHLRGRTFWAATLLRACGRLRVGADYVATPMAQCRTIVTHQFLLGG